MLLAVVGDTHGRIDPVQRALQHKKLDYLLFTGDFYGDGVQLAGKLEVPFCGVRGNSDLARKGKKEQRVDLEGYRIYLVHGHQYGVKRGLNNLWYRGEEVKADLVLFGHTHVPWCEQIEGRWFFNPGSPTYPRGQNPGTYGLISLEDGQISPQIVIL